MRTSYPGVGANRYGFRNESKNLRVFAFKISNAEQVISPKQVGDLKKENTSSCQAAFSPEPGCYAELFTGIKNRVRVARVRAGLAANQELILLYWDIGRLVAERQDSEGRGGLENLDHGLS